MTQANAACVKCKSCWMVGRATFTIVWSSVFISIAKQTTIKATHRRLP